MPQEFSMKAKIAVAAAVVAAGALGATLVSIANSTQAPSKGSALDEKAVEAIVARYISENPQAIIDALEKHYQNQQAMAAENGKRAVKENIKTLMAAESGYVAGKAPDRAKVVVIEFFDYQCGFCKKATDSIMKLTSADPEVKVSFREFPILSEDSAVAAAYALAAREQGKYKEFHVALMKHSGRLNAEEIKKVSDSVGLDPAKLNNARKNVRIAEILDQNRQLAGQIGLTGTPGIIVATTDGGFVEIIDGWREDKLMEAIKAAKKAI
jgi:protein-disulfide isomerase